MKIPLLALFVFMAGLLHAQLPFCVLSGKVTDCKYTTPIAGAVVQLVTNAGEKQECITDADGEYYLFVSPGKVCSITVYPPDWRKDKCGMLNGFLSKTDSHTGWNAERDSAGKPINTAHDFCLVPMEYELRFPALFFEKNSTSFRCKQPWPETSPDSALQFMACVMNDNPTMVVEVGAHASAGEKNAIQLSADRAQRVIDLLNKQYNIPADRFEPKGYGDLRPLVLADGTHLTPKYLRLLWIKSRSRHDSLAALNRRCVFRVIRWDYPAPKTDTIKKRTPADHDTFLAGQVTDAIWGIPIRRASVQVTGSDGTLKKLVTDSMGAYRTWLKPHLRYNISVYDDSAWSDTSVAWKSHYRSLKTAQRINTDSTAGTLFTGNMTMNCQPVGTLHVPYVCFSENSTETEKLNDFDNFETCVDFLKQWKESSITIRAHADSTEKKPDQLAQKRAEALKEQLIEEGISANRIKLAEEQNVRPVSLREYYQVLHPPGQPRLSPEDEAALKKKLNRCATIRLDTRLGKPE